MIPDKIYLPKYPNYDIEGEHLGDDWSYEPEFTDNVTYIRKDTLLKWINKARSIPHENAIARDLTFQEVVNYLVNEM